MLHNTSSHLYIPFSLFALPRRSHPLNGTYHKLHLYPRNRTPLLLLLLVLFLLLLAFDGSLNPLFFPLYIRFLSYVHSLLSKRDFEKALIRPPTCGLVKSLIVFLPLPKLSQSSWTWKRPTIESQSLVYWINSFGKPLPHQSFN
jgi:hypothetical protein